MGRLPRITAAELTGATRRVAARLGPAGATVEAIAREAGVPVGSIYHRSPSRAALLAAAWIDAAERFEAMLLDELAVARTIATAAEAALATPRFARLDHAGGVLLFVHRRDDFLSDAPAELNVRATKLSAGLRDHLGETARRLLPGAQRGRERMALALLAMPSGAMRAFLPQAPPPPALDPVIVAAARAALEA